MPGSSPARRTVMRVTTRGFGGLHRTLYRASGGRIGGSVKGMSILLLTTAGRKTGKVRTNPLGFIRDGDNLVVVASNGGMDWSPAWWLNLQHNPDATVEIGHDRRHVKARKASPQERTRLWADITNRFPGYGNYQQRTRREIPVVILQPATNTHDGNSQASTSGQ